MKTAIACAVAVALWALVAPMALAETTVVIEATRLAPRVQQAVIGERVTFVNRSGHLVHVEFSGRPEQHRVFQVPGSIWAVFHRDGQHPYVVHLGPDQRTEWRGVIDVRYVPGGVTDDPTCGRLSVMDVCLEP